MIMCWFITTVVELWESVSSDLLTIVLNVFLFENARYILKLIYGIILKCVHLESKNLLFLLRSFPLTILKTTHTQTTIINAMDKCI